MDVALPFARDRLVSSIARSLRGSTRCTKEQIPSDRRSSRGFGRHHATSSAAHLSLDDRHARMVSRPFDARARKRDIVSPSGAITSRRATTICFATHDSGTRRATDGAFRWVSGRSSMSWGERCDDRRGRINTLRSLQDTSPPFKATVGGIVSRRREARVTSRLLWLKSKLRRHRFVLRRHPLRSRRLRSVSR
jgi:hypothetical protein